MNKHWLRLAFSMKDGRTLHDGAGKRDEEAPAANNYPARHLRQCTCFRADVLARHGNQQYRLTEITL